MRRNQAKRVRRRIAISLVLASINILVLFPGLSVAQEENALPPGLYRLEMIMASTSCLPFFGTSKSVSRSVSLVEIKRDGANLVQSHEVCDFRALEDSAMIKMVFPDKFVAALAKHTYPIRIDKDGQGWRYRADLGIERIGYKPISGDSQLPANVDDASVYDWDGDGQPGATLKISVPLLPEGELYVVQRGQSILNGRIAQAGRIEGSIEVRSFEHRVLGAWPGFLNRSPEIIPDPKESRFSIIPIPHGSSCETLRGMGARGQAGRFIGACLVLSIAGHAANDSGSSGTFSHAENGGRPARRDFRPHIIGTDQCHHTCPQRSKADRELS